MKLTQFDFPSAQYFSKEVTKKQIYLHHTAGNADPFGVFRDWATTDTRVATCVVVGGKPKADSNWIDGEVVQGFSSKLYAYHLGLKESVFEQNNIPYDYLDEMSIGIEICNWGQLTLKNGVYYNYVNKEVAPNNVITLDTPHRGYKYYHAYTDAQIVAVKELLILWRDKYNIPIGYNPDIFDICPRALRAEKGVFTHNSVRTDKVDISPQPKMIEMLKSL